MKLVAVHYALAQEMLSSTLQAFPLHSMQAEVVVERRGVVDGMLEVEDVDEHSLV